MSTEEKAKRMGWVSEENFKGDKERWIDAEKFVERGENELPIMRERMRKMDGTIVGLNNTISNMKDTFGKFQEHQADVSKRAYNRAMKDITNRQREAVEKGDTDSFDKAEKEKDDLVLEIPDVPVGNQPAEAEFNQWVASNNWFNEPDLQKYASTMSVYIQDQTGLTGVELYDEVKKEVELRFPDRFKNKRRSEPTAVVGGGEAPAKPGKQTFNNLPKDAQEMCNQFIKEIPGYTKEQYLKDYQW